MGNMAFMCPHLSIWAGKSEKSPHRTMMYENILLVDEEGYNSCSVKNGTMKTLLRCDEDPMGGQVKYTNEKFSSTQAHRDKQCYEQGQHYYFICKFDTCDRNKLQYVASICGSSTHYLNDTNKEATM